MPARLQTFVCLLAFSSLSGGAPANLSLQRSPLDVSRVARSVLAARVIDEMGNPVRLRSTGGHTRRIVNPFVTSHNGRPVTRPQRRQVTSGESGQTSAGSSRLGTKHDSKLKHNRVLSHRHINRTTNQHRQNSRPTNQHRQNSRPTNQHRQNSVSANQHRQNSMPTNQHRQNSVLTNQHRRNSVPTNQHHRHNVPTNQQYRQTMPRGGTQVSPSDSRVMNGQSADAAGDAIHMTSYTQGLEAHMSLNEARMVTFFFKRSGRRRPRVDRTSGLGTLHSSRAGRCPVVDQSGCPPLPRAPLPPSCSNDFQCHEPNTKCCYDPCLTLSKCVRPVGA